jgi:glycosyltransferase involved in cell wall biosynthesis
MRIAAISTAQIPSSTANSIQVMKVCQALTQNGHSVTLYVPGLRYPNRDALAEQYGLSASFEINWLACHPMLKRNDFAWNALRRARSAGAEWVYTWALQSAVFGLGLGLPVVLELHDLPTGRLGPFWLRAFLRLGGAKRLAIITQALKHLLEQRYGRLLIPEQVIIAPNGVELERYRLLPAPSEARRMLGLAEGITVNCTGHLYAGRGGELFLGLARRFPQARFVWVGGRLEDVTAFSARAEAGGLTNVTFTGFIPNARLPLYQAAADIVLMPYGRAIAGSSGGNSAEICSPMKLFDYLAVGRAILSSDLPVIHEVLDDQSALFAQPEDVEAWSAALERLLAHEDLRVRLSANAQAKAARYDWRVRESRIIEAK